MPVVGTALDTVQKGLKRKAPLMAQSEALAATEKAASKAFTPDTLALSALVRGAASGAGAQRVYWRDAQSLMRKTQVEINREVGANREALVSTRLKRRFPQSEGFVVLPQAYLRDSAGKILKDAVSGEARRVDFVVFRHRTVVTSLEITSKTASKVEQMAKEERIRQSGGNFILHPETGALIHFPERLHTKVWRLD